VLLLAIVVAACGATLYLGSLIVDGRIQTALKPMQDNITQITGDVREIKGELTVLRAENVAEKYSATAPKELQAHREELNNIKTDLVSTPKILQIFGLLVLRLLPYFLRQLPR